VLPHVLEQRVEPTTSVKRKARCQTAKARVDTRSPGLSHAQQRIDDAAPAAAELRATPVTAEVGP